MPIYRGTLLFEYKYWRAGWAEIYYYDAADNAGADKTLSSLSDRRAYILADGVELTAYRFQQIDQFRSTVAKSGLHKTGETDIGGADTPWQSLLCRFYSGNQYTRPLFLRGIPDCFVNQGGDDDVTKAGRWIERVKSFLKRMKADGIWKIRSASKDPTKSLPFVVNSIVPSTNPSEAIVSTYFPFQGKQGDRVTIYARGWKPPIGTKTVLLVSESTKFLIGYKGTHCGPTGKMTGRIIVNDFFPIDDWSIERVNHRDTGRPFAQPVGRRSSRPCFCP